MRAVSRLLAAVKPGQYLEANAPTGLTGLLTHPTPRSTLIYHYISTLDKLKQIPESSVYRQSTEALTKHRLSIVEQVKPVGFDAWQDKVQAQIADHGDQFEVIKTPSGSVVSLPKNTDIDFRLRESEWDGEEGSAAKEGIRSYAERKDQNVKFTGSDKAYHPEREVQKASLDPEPQLTVDQIHQLESQIGAGLIEEVIQVAEGEHNLVDTMVKNQVWEELVEKPAEGQWNYHERTAHHTSTQKP